MDKLIYLDTCYFCHSKWGECQCKDVGEDEGFEHEGTTIVQPCLSTCGRFFVNPILYYGESYKGWRFYVYE